MPPTKPATSPNYALMGFLAAAIAVLGMIGVMATYIVPLPLERALRAGALLDQAEIALAGPQPQQALQALAPELGRSGMAEVAKLAAGPQAGEQVRAARQEMRARLLAESQGTSARLRIMILVCSLMAMLFGALAVHGARRR